MNTAYQPAVAPGPAARPASALPAGAAQRLALVYRLILDRVAEAEAQQPAAAESPAPMLVLSEAQPAANGA